MEKNNLKYINTIVIMCIFCIYIFINLNIKNMNTSDDAIFLKDFKLNYNGNYLSFFKFRYQEWTSRSIIEYFLTFFVQHIMLWRIVNAIAMTTVSVLPAFIVKKNPTAFDITLNFLLFLLIPIGIIRETGWVATTTNYLWVMACGLVSVYPTIRYIRDQYVSKKMIFFSLMLSLYANNQEQMVILLILIFSSCLFVLWKSNKKTGLVASFLGVSILSLIYILTCPGNEARTIVETRNFLPGFPEYTLLYKIYLGYTTTLMHLYYNLDPFIAFFSLSITALGLSRFRNWFHTILSCLPMVIYFFNQSIIEKITKNYNLSDGDWHLSLTLIVTIVSILYILSIYVTCTNMQQFIISLIMLLVGLFIRMILGFSPTLWASGNRTYFFTYVIFMMAVLFNFSKINRRNILSPIAGYYVALSVTACIIVKSVLILISAN